jgi:hypothetical protein
MDRITNILDAIRRIGNPTQRCALSQSRRLFARSTKKKENSALLSRTSVCRRHGFRCVGFVQAQRLDDG